MQDIQYNQFPEGFEHPYDKFKVKGNGSIMFRLLNIKRSTDPDPEINGRLLIPAITHITPVSTIAIDGEVVTIAAIDGRTGELSMACQFLESRAGILSLSTKNPKHIPLIKWMLLTPRNSKSPYAGSDGKAPIFETINFETESVVDVESNERKAEAVMSIGRMSDDGLRDSYSVIFQKSSQSLGINQVKVALQDLAFSNPDKLLKAISKKEINLEALAREAKDLKIIVNDQGAQAFKFVKSDEVFFEYKSGKGFASPYAQLAEHLANDKEAFLQLKSMIELAKD